MNKIDWNDLNRYDKIAVLVWLTLTFAPFFAVIEPAPGYALATYLFAAAAAAVLFGLPLAWLFLKIRNPLRSLLKL